jgi:hypothetical protein
MVISIKTNKKNRVSFMPHAFNESGHRFGQFGDFTQVENFEKP